MQLTITSSVQNALLVGIMCFCFSSLQAQESINTAGGIISNSNGSVTYSVGQIFQNYQSSADYFVVEGVQQAYEISSILSIAQTPLSIQFSVFPNPTRDFLMLSHNEPTSEMSYQLINIQGQLIENHSILSQETSIDLTDLPTAVYFLNVNKNNQQVASFKILKK